MNSCAPYSGKYCEPEGLYTLFIDGIPKLQAPDIKAVRDLAESHACTFYGVKASDHVKLMWDAVLVVNRLPFVMRSVDGKYRIAVNKYTPLSYINLTEQEL